MRTVVEPTRDERGQESHPAWVMIGASRVSSGPPGAVLFDSDIRHQHYIVVTLTEATRERDLNRDWLHGRGTIFEVALSEAQWASFVSSMNVGGGVPATLQYRDGVGDLPGMPYSPRLQESLDEVRDAANRAQAQVLAAFETYKGAKTVGNLRSLEAAINNLPSNLQFAAASLSEHAENVVQRARADIESFVMAKARQLGLDPADLGATPELTAGQDGGRHE